MNKDNARKLACQVLRAKVRYAHASLTLPGNPFGCDDTGRIKEATRLFVESWIVPIIDDIERGNYEYTKRYLQSDERHEMKEAS